MNMETTDLRLITCILYRGGGDAVMKALHKRGFDAVTMTKGRGSAIGDPTDEKGHMLEFEKEIVTVMTPADEADSLMEFIFETADIDRPYGGFLYMEKLGRGTPFVLPDLPEES